MNKDMNNLRKTVRPKAHASPRENAMYRSFGSLYSRGKYHIFFEHFPFGLYSSHRFVGHAESDDLIFWKSKPIAIYSTKTNDFDGAYEGSCLEDESGMVLYYMGINYTTRDMDDVNSYVHNTPIKTNLMACHSFDTTSSEFDNVKKKETLFSDSNFVEMGFESGTIKDPEAYKIDDNTRFITFLAKDIKSKKQALGFIKAIKEKDGSYSYQYVGKQLLEKEDEEIRTIKFFKSEDNYLVTLESNFPKIKMEREQLPEFKVFVGRGTIDFEKCKFKIEVNSLIPLDYGFDVRAPKVAYDTRNLPYIMCSTKMTHDIKGSMGMITLPRRVTCSSDGSIETYIHPIITQRMIYKSNDEKIRQTHFPLLITANLRDSSSIAVGGLGIYRTDGILHVDRRNISDLPKEGHVRINVAKIPVKDQVTSLRIFLDQDIVEIEINEKQMISFITLSDDTTIKQSGIENYETYTLNQTKI